MERIDEVQQAWLKVKRLRGELDSCKAEVKDFQKKVDEAEAVLEAVLDDQQPPLFDKGKPDGSH